MIRIKDVQLSSLLNSLIVAELFTKTKYFLEIRIAFESVVVAENPVCVLGILHSTVFSSANSFSIFSKRSSWNCDVECDRDAGREQLRQLFYYDK